MGKGFQLSDLFPVRQGLSSVSKSGLKILGACFLRLSGVSGTGQSFSCGAFTYVSPNISGFYLFQNAMVQLGIIASTFPSVGATSELNAVVNENRGSNATACDCPRRELPPAWPEKLPYEATVENIEVMKDWLLEHFSSSTFNTCPHQSVVA